MSFIFDDKSSTGCDPLFRSSEQSSHSCNFYDFLSLPESDEDMELTFEDAPDRKDDEDGTEYYDRTKEYWFEQARSYCQNQGLRMSDRKLAKLASEMCLDVYEAGND